MATGKVIIKQFVKHSKTATTSATGSIIISSTSRKIAFARLNDTNNQGFAFIRGDADVIKVVDSNFAPIANTEVTVDYYVEVGS